MPRVAITVPDKSPQPYRFPLDRQKVLIGRSSECDIVIDCGSVSGKHCVMERVDGGYILRDIGSTNGISLKDEDMAIIDLRNDSEVKVGDVKFEYTLSDDELDELDDEDFVPHAKKASEIEKDEEDSEEEEEKPRKKASSSKPTPKRKPIPATSRAPVTPPPTLVNTSSSGGGFLGFATFLCGIAAFYAGIDHSYSGKQREAGRKGDFSLITDIKDGRPPLNDEAGEE